MDTLDDVVKDVQERLAELPRRVAVIMADLHVPEVPFDTGSAQGSFTPSLTGATRPYREVSNGPRYPQRAEVRAVARSMRPGDSFWLVGNAPHLPALEFGHSGQAPSGFHRIAMAQTQAVVDRVVRELS